MNDEEIKKFLDRIRIEGEHWVWQGKPTARGHGRFGPAGNLLAHRVAYELFVGEIPERHNLARACDRAMCVNPKHHKVLNPTEMRQWAANSRKPRDGWEDEYGPIPAKIPDREWYDWVAVEAALAGRPVRKLTPPENREFYRRTMHLPTAVVAELVGLSVGAVEHQRSRLVVSA